MAFDTIPIPFGLRDIKLTAYTDAAGTTLDTTVVDLPYGRTLSFTESEDFEDLRGDDRLVTSHGSGPQVAWELESGAISLEAYKIMAGGTVVTSGTGNAQVKTFRKKVTQSRPFFKLEGQVISDSGGDFHCVLPRCKATGDLSGEFGDGEFFLTSASGAGYASLIAGDGLDDAYNFVHNQTVTPIASS